MTSKRESLDDIHDLWLDDLKLVATDAEAAAVNAYWAPRAQAAKRGSGGRAKPKAARACVPAPITVATATSKVVSDAGMSIQILDTDRVLEAEQGHGRGTFTVPVGHLHHSELKNRGWTREMIAALLPDEVVVRIDAPNGVSPRCYPVAVVEQAEATPEFRAHVEAAEQAAESAWLEAEARATAEAAALAAQMPRREGGYSESECVGRAWLKACGWTEGHIKRLLGPADATGYGYRTPADLWSRERAEQAMAEDDALIKRITQYKAKQAEAKAKAVERSLDAGRAVFRKQGDTWLLVGRGLQVGQTVTVALRNGNTVDKRVARILSTTDDGIVTAEPIDERREQWAQERAAEAARRAEEKASRAELDARLAQEGRPTGAPALPYGSRRNQRAGWCNDCRTHIPADGGLLHRTVAVPGVDCEYDEDDFSMKWVVICPACTWRTRYALDQATAVAGWVALGWTVADVRLAVDAGVTADEAAKADPADQETRSQWEMLRALRQG